MRSTDPILRGDRDKDDIRTHEQNTGPDEEYASEATINSQQVASLSTKKALWAYLILCFSVRIFQDIFVVPPLLMIETRPARLAQWLSIMSQRQSSLPRTPLAISRDQTNPALAEGISNA